MEKVLLMYSGGLDSFLSACRLVQAGYQVLLIHFDNGSIIGTEYIEKGANVLKERFGKRIEYLGIVSTAGVNMRLKKIENQKLSTIAMNFGNTTLSQYQCLICRSAMYYYAAAICLEKGIHYVAEGARKSQKFAIEQTPILEEYYNFLKQYDLELLLPVIDLEDDVEKILEINEWGYPAIPYESKCLLGYHLEDEYPVDDEIIEGTLNIFKSIIRPELDKLMNDENSKNIIKHLEYPKDKVTWY